MDIKFNEHPYKIEFNENYADSSKANGFLIIFDDECVGSFHKVGDEWTADINVMPDGQTDTFVLGNFPKQEDAMLKLWENRHQAYSYHHDWKL